MIVTVTCANANCRKEIGRSAMDPGRVERYLQNLRVQRLTCKHCHRVGSADLAVVDGLADTSPEPEPAPEPEPEPEADSPVPDTLPDDIDLPPLSNTDDDTDVVDD